MNSLPMIPGFKITMWSKVAGKERVYLTLLAKSNGGRTWNTGVGREDYLDITTMTWHEKTEWAGGATMAQYGDAVTAAKAAIAAAFAAPARRRETNDYLSED